MHSESGHCSRIFNLKGAWYHCAEAIVNNGIKIQCHEETVDNADLSLLKDKASYLEKGNATLSEDIEQLSNETISAKVDGKTYSDALRRAIYLCVSNLAIWALSQMVLTGGSCCPLSGGVIRLRRHCKCNLGAVMSRRCYCTGLETNARPLARGELNSVRASGSSDLTSPVGEWEFYSDLSIIS